MKRRECFATPVGRPQGGSITAMLLIMMSLLLAVASYSLYVGQEVERKIRIQNAADAGAEAMAGHGAQGLNMISVNNLAMGAALNIAGSLPILASYLSMARALTYDFGDVLNDFAALFAGVNKIQEDVWNPISHAAGLFFHVASGLSSFNEHLSKRWMIAAPVRGLEVARLNVPGSIGLPLQQAVANRVRPVVLEYAGLRQVSPAQSMCHAIRSATFESSRPSDFVVWLEGPLLTLESSKLTPAALRSLASGIRSLTEGVRQAFDKIGQVIPAFLGYVDCGHGMRMSFIKTMQDILRVFMSGNGLKNVGEIGKGEYFGAFAAMKPDFDRDDDWWEFFGENPCKGPWSAVAQGHAASLQMQVQNDEDLRVQVGIMRVLDGIRKHESSITSARTFECVARDATGARKGSSVEFAAPVVTGSGAIECVPLNSVIPACALGDRLRIVPIPLCNDYVDEHNNNVVQRCEAYRRIERHGSGVGIVDAARQMETYYSGRFGQKRPDRAGTLGFTVVGASRPFTRAASVGLLVGTPLRYSDAADRSSCRDELSNHDEQGVARCLEAGMQGASRSAREVLTADGSVLRSTWARTLWAYGEARIIFSPGPADPRPGSDANLLFLPAWRVRPVPPTMLKGALGLIAGDADSGGILGLGSILGGGG